MSADRAERARAGAILAASLASTIGGLPFNSLPVMLGSLADSFKLAPQAVGLMGSICFAGYLLGTLGAPFWIDRLNWRLLTALSAAGTAGAFALSASVKALPSLYAMWALIGFFASTMTCLGLRILSDMPDKVRAFGFRQGVELSVTAAVLFALPPLVMATYRYPGAALALAAAVGLLGLSAPWVPARPLAPAGPQRAGLRSVTPRAWLCLAVFFVFLTGNIALWAFLERIGAGIAIAAAEMGIVFAVLKLLGGLAAFSVAALGDRAGQRAPHVVVLAGVAVGLAALASAQGFASFAIGAWLWEFSFTCGCVFQAALVARHDRSGRAIVLIPAVFALGSMVGPGMAGYLVAGGSHAPLLWLAAAATLVPVLAHSITWRGSEVGGAARQAGAGR